MSALIDKPEVPHKNGWRRDEVWEEDNGMAPDALYAITAFYSKPGSDWRGEVTYYVEPCKTYNQPEVRDAFHVEMCIRVYREVYDRRGVVIDTTDEEIDYDYGSVLYYDTEESATSEARRLGMNDEAYVFCA